jgi:hypothetical protein
MSFYSNEIWGKDMFVMFDSHHLCQVNWQRKSDKGQTPFFLALCDQEGECIDAKYISDVTVANLLEGWGVPLLTPE